MIERVPKQQYVEIFTIPFHNNYAKNAQLEHTGKMKVALQPESPLHYVVYTISEENAPLIGSLE